MEIIEKNGLTGLLGGVLCRYPVLTKSLDNAG